MFCCICILDIYLRKLTHPVLLSKYIQYPAARHTKVSVIDHGYQFFFTSKPLRLGRQIAVSQRYWKFILGGDIEWGCRCVTLCCDHDLTFDFAVQILTIKVLSGLHLGN